MLFSSFILIYVIFINNLLNFIYNIQMNKLELELEEVRTKPIFFSNFGSYITTNNKNQLIEISMKEYD